tara:strand:+ start:138 stop:293 length:156 start_codon:yes stop_codon:yes gene_type:complete
MFDWITRLETYLLVKAHKLEFKLTDEEFNERVRKQIDIIKTERLTKNINLD